MIISSRGRFFLNPSFHVTQNIHPTAHHTWEEIQIVIRLRVCVSGEISWFVQDLRILRCFISSWNSFFTCRWYMSTVSMIFPSASSNKNFVVSGPSTSSLSLKSTIFQSFLRSSLRSLERVVISSTSIMDSL